MVSCATSVMAYSPMGSLLPFSVAAWPASSITVSTAGPPFTPCQTGRTTDPFSRTLGTMGDFTDAHYFNQPFHSRRKKWQLCFFFQYIMSVSLVLYLSPVICSQTSMSCWFVHTLYIRNCCFYCMLFFFFLPFAFFISYVLYCCVFNWEK